MLKPAPAAIALLILLFHNAASAQTTQSIAKKLIEFGWDEPDTAFMQKHIAEMEQTPFDGTVFHITYEKRDGSRGNFMNEAWSDRPFTLAELSAPPTNWRIRRSSDSIRISCGSMSCRGMWIGSTISTR